MCVSLAILFCQHSDISVYMRNYCKSYLVVVPRTSGRPSLIVLRMRGSRETLYKPNHACVSPVHPYSLFLYADLKLSQGRENSGGSLPLASLTEYLTSRPASFPYREYTSRLTLPPHTYTAL